MKKDSLNKMRNSANIEQFIYNMKVKYIYINESVFKSFLVQNSSKRNTSTSFVKPYEVIKNER